MWFFRGTYLNHQRCKSYHKSYLFQVRLFTGHGETLVEYFCRNAEYVVCTYTYNHIGIGEDTFLNEGLVLAFVLRRFFSSSHKSTT